MKYKLWDKVSKEWVHNIEYDNLRGVKTNYLTNQKVGTFNVNHNIEDIDDGNWGHTEHNNSRYLIQPDGQIISISYGYNRYSCEFTDFIVQNNIEVLRYSGMNDKNNNEIYQGDILRYDDGEIVTVDDCYGSFEIAFRAPIHHISLCDLKRKYDVLLHSELSFDEKIKLDSQLAELQIIGNIYENPELRY